MHTDTQTDRYKKTLFPSFGGSIYAGYVMCEAEKS